MTVRLLIKHPRPRFSAADVIHPSIDRLNETFKNALAQALWMGSHGAVSFIVVNDNG